MKNGQQPITPILDMNDDKSGLIVLTKREYFAGIAMQGVLSHNHPANPTPNQAEEIVKYAIGLADELLKQLEK